MTRRAALLVMLLAVGACSAPASSGGGTSASALDAAYTSVVDSVAPSVVLIESTDGLGSGEVYDDKGDIVTNAHVVGSATAFQVTTSDGRRHAATLAGSFPPDDLAVIRVTGGGSGLKPAVFGDSSKLRVGQPVVAIGNPLGLTGSVTSGIVSALNRVVSEGPGGGTLPDAIQTSAPINPGNSGGALVDLQSRVIGIPTLAALTPGSGGAQAPGIAFAISSNRAKTIAQQLIANGKVTSSGRAYLGVQTGSAVGGKGVVVVTVEAGGPAARAGIEAGSLITAVAGKPTPDTGALATVLAGLSPGQTVPVAVLHPDGAPATAQVTLGELPG